MTDTPRGGFEDRLRAALTARAGSVSAPPDEPGMAAVAARARLRHSRRRWEAATLGVAVVMAVGLSVAVTSGGAGPRETASQAGARSGPGAPGRHHLDRHDGVLLLPLSGTVSASSPGARSSFGVLGPAAPGATGAAQTTETTTASAAVPDAASPPPTTVPGAASGNTASSNTASSNAGSSNAGSSDAGSSSTASGNTAGPIDVAPSSSTPLQRLYGHTSADGVQMTLFDQPAGNSAGKSAGNSAGNSAGADDAGCLTTTQLTVEISDTEAVGRATEPLFKGAAGALVDVQVGEIGNTEGAPATWVLAQVGAGAATVEVQFADGAIDQASVPGSGVVVLGHTGAPADALGNGSVAAIDVVGSGGQVLAGYGLGTESSVPTGGEAPSSLPPPGAAQPTDPAGATTAITRALTTALGCSASPVQRIGVIAGGDPVETLPDFGGTATVRVDRVVFTSASSAVAQYHLYSGQLDAGQHETGPLYAAATLVADTWQLSLASVAPGLQVTPAHQVGNVTVAPGGPLFVKTWPGGTAVAVYRALPGSQSGPGYGTGDAACTPAGGIVEEVTTPGAVAVLSAALFPNYAAPLIDAAVSSVGTAEGAPATVVDVETGPQAASVSVTRSTGTVRVSPVDGAAVIVLPGAPSSALNGAGSELQVSDGSGATLATVSLQVESTAPAGPSTLPPSLPTTGGQGPADPQAATAAITQAFAAVFDCATPPVQRVQSIQDGSLVAGALEQLDTGPYEALASSSYIDVQRVVFENPTLADVAYTLRFHSDAGLTFPMVGRAVVVAGTWRVSYGTICAAIQLGLANCQS